MIAGKRHFVDAPGSNHIHTEDGHGFWQTSQSHVCRDGSLSLLKSVLHHPIRPAENQVHTRLRHNDKFRDLFFVYMAKSLSDSWSFPSIHVHVSEFS